MKATCSCAAPSSPTKRAFRFFRWILPGTILALMPKCPVCLAAYIALFSGIGISLPVASFLRTGLIVLCVLALVFLVVRQIRRLISRPSMGA